MKIFVCPVANVSDCYAALRPQRVLGLLSPGQDEAPLTMPRTERLELRFNDIDGERAGLVPPSDEDVRAILNFAHAADSLLIYCFAGISRSTAAAYAIACKAHERYDERAIANALRRLSPSATPNPLMISLADKMLRRDGRMTSAIAGIARGDGLFSGSSFALTEETISG